MKNWNVYADVRGSKYLGEVEAETKEEAEKAAWSDLDFSISVCHQCSSEVEDPEVYEIVVEEMEEQS